MAFIDAHRQNLGLESVCASWQRCRIHFMRNALAHAGKSGRRVVSVFIGTAFAQDTPEANGVSVRARGVISGVD